MSVSRVQPPHVHQQFCVAFATAAVLFAHAPGLVGGMSGMSTPELMTSWIHCLTSGESVGGVLSSGG